MKASKIFENDVSGKEANFRDKLGCEVGLGRFVGELTKQVLSYLDASKYQVAEYRLSIDGRTQSKWDHLASWFINNQIYNENVVWLIQVKELIDAADYYVDINSSDRTIKKKMAVDMRTSIAHAAMSDQGSQSHTRADMKDLMLLDRSVFFGIVDIHVMHMHSFRADLKRLMTVFELELKGLQFVVIFQPVVVLKFFGLKCGKFALGIWKSSPEKLRDERQAKTD
ncbi:probable AMP deaminase [Tanacetum coccineum]